MGTDNYFLASVYDSIQPEDIKHVWYSEPIVQYILFTYFMLVH